MGELNRNKEIIIQKGLMLLKDHKPKEAVSYFKDLLIKDPKNPELFFHISNIYLRNKKFKTAKKYIKKCILLFSKSAEAWNNYGLIEKSLGNSILAKKYFKRALEIDPFLIPSFKNLISIYLEEKNYLVAQEFIEQLLKIDLNDEESFFFKYCNQILIGNLKSASISLDEIIKINPNYQFRTSLDHFHQKVPIKLLKAIIDGNCVLFIGSGISSFCVGKGRRTLPIWSEFLLNFIEWNKNRGTIEDRENEDLKRLLLEKKYTIIAEELLEKTPPEDFKKFLEEIFEPKSIIPSYLHKLIITLPFRSIITTNYDNLLEQVYFEKFRKYPKIFYHNNLDTTILPFDLDFSILKLHGDIENPKSIILSQKQFSYLMFGSPNYQKYLESLFTNFSVFFIGYGLRDPDIENMIEKVSLNIKAEKFTHFILSKEGTFTEIEKKRMLKDKNIQTIVFKEDYRHIETFFKSLVQTYYGMKDPREIVTGCFDDEHILLFFNSTDEVDGEFLYNFLFKNGAVVGPIPSHQFKSLTSELLTFLKFPHLVIFLLGSKSFKKNKIKFSESLLNAKNLFINNNIPIIIVFVENSVNRKFISINFPNFPLFEVPLDFVDANLENLKQHIVSRLKVDLSIKKEILPCSGCKFFEPKRKINQNKKRKTKKDLSN